MRWEEGVCVSIAEARARSLRRCCCVLVGRGRDNHHAVKSLAGIASIPAKVSDLYEAARWSVRDNHVVNSLCARPRAALSTVEDHV